MVLRTLGGLGLEGADFERSKPLLLLCYLSLEGAKPRRHLAELFWQGAAHPLGSLSVALSQLRQGAPGSFAADARSVHAGLACDAHQLLAALDDGEIATALKLYRGAFLSGVYLAWSAELEEWVYATRESLAGRLRAGLLSEAERKAAAGHFAAGAELGERAYRFPDAPPLEPDELRRLYALLQAGGHPASKQARREAEAFGLTLALAPAAARAQLAAPPAAGGEATSPPLPRAKTPLVGRALELREIAGLLARPDCRLLSLVGPGGIGKTRLALQAAEEQRANVSGGVCFAPLETLTAAEQLPTTLARALGGSLSAAGDPRTELASLIGDRQVLLVLDNFEQLMPGRALLIGLLERCPRLKLLVTSRQRLQLAEEWVLNVQGLALPPTGGAQACDAVTLFAQRARRADARFSLAEHASAVLAICRAVEGSPLGIELAATWVRAAPCAQLAEEIGRNPDVLAAAVHDLPERHQSLRATFEHSWRLLSADERDVLAKLSVFGGSFDREAAREVAGASLPLLAALLDKSLLRSAAGGRFDWHPLLRQYAGEKLAQRAAEQRATHARHGRYYLARVRAQARRLHSSGQGNAFDALEQELGNLRLAWRWAVEAGEVASLGACAFVLAQFFDKRARAAEGAASFALALERLDEHERGQRATLGRLLVGQAWLQLRLGSYEEGRQLAERGTALLAAETDETGLGWALQTLASADYKLGAYERARARFQALLEHAERQGDEAQVAYAHGRLGVVEQARGDDGAARTHYQAALGRSRALRDHPVAVAQLLNLGALELNTGHTERAEKLFREGLTLARHAGDRQVVPVLLHNLANVACKQVRFTEARALAQEALELVRESGERALETGMLATLSWIALEAGEPADAEAHASDSLRLAWAISDIPATLTALLRLAELWLAQGRQQQALRLLRLIYHHPAALTWVRRRAARPLEASGDFAGNPEALDALLSEVLVGA